MHATYSLGEKRHFKIKSRLVGLLNATQMLLLTEPLALKQIVYIHKHSLILSYRISIGHGINEYMVVVSLRSAS